MKLIYKATVCLILLLDFFGTSAVFSQEFKFDRNLSIGLLGDDVLLLQKILNRDLDTLVSNEGPGSPGFETYYFGQKTKNAVIKYQEKYGSEILLPLGLQYGTGMVGLQTRNKLNSIAVNVPSVVAPVLPINIPTPRVNNTVKLKPPTIESVSPLEVSDPLSIPVIIKGENFTAQNKVLLGIDQYETFNAPSADGKTIKVFLNTMLISGMERLMNSIPKTPGGNEIERARASIKKELGSNGKNGLYVPAIVVVENENGKSGKVLIKINVLSDEKQF